MIFETNSFSFIPLNDGLIRSRKYTIKKPAISLSNCSNEEINTELSNIESIRESVLELKQDLASIKEFSPVEQRNLHQTWVNLNGDLKAQIEKLATAEAEYGRLTALVNEFVNAHSEYTTEYLGELNQITQNTIGQYKNLVDTLRSKCTAAEKTHKTMQENVDGHLSKKPSNLADEDTEESLNERIKLYNEERDNLNQQIGEITQALQTDDEARKKKQDTAHIEILKEEYEKTKALESLVGKENITTDGRRIDLFANISDVTDVKDVLDNDAGGIGLFRSEFLYFRKAPHVKFSDMATAFLLDYIAAAFGYRYDSIGEILIESNGIVSGHN